MRGFVVLLAAGAFFASRPLQAQTAQSSASGGPSVSAATERALVDKYCVSCHNQKLRTGGIALDKLDIAHVAADAETWEKVVRKVQGRLMPPAGLPRPDREGYDGLVKWLVAQLDLAAEAHPNPGRTDPLHRLNRVEYQNSVRDLLALDVDVSSWLPADPSSYGFDNNGDALGVVSPVLLERYLSTAQRITRLAVGDPETEATLTSYVVPSDLTQRDHIDGLPFGTWGGVLIQHNFPQDGEYVFHVRLGRNFNTNINALADLQQLEIAVDGERVKVFPVGGKRRGGRAVSLTKAEAEQPAKDEDEALVVRVPVKAGPRSVSVAFINRPRVQFEDQRKPLLKDDPGAGDQQRPSVSRVDIDGPYSPTGSGFTPSRQRIFFCRPATAAAEPECARTIVSTFAHRAYRRPVSDADMQLLMGFYDDGRAAGGFEKGVEYALTRILISPSFLFRIERDPAGAAPGSNYRIGDLDLASRLSFFLWSSIPDDQLLELAERGQLRDPAVLDRQVARMLDDPRSDALVGNFTGQWLHIRDLSSVRPDRFAFPDFDENLRHSLQRETELFVESILRSDKSVLELLTANYTFLNERLARHYGIPNIYGDQFRRVTLTDESRFGLLGQGSLLTLTSYANRTSPVVRGKWILENILGTKPPDPPPNVPPLADAAANGKVLTMRERMVQHRANPVCASCHAMMDPIGLSLENFDGVGRWRAAGESGAMLDVSGALPDGTKFRGAAGLRQALLAHSSQFVTTMTEKLLTYALGRGLEYYDEPAVRLITREASARNYRFSDLVTNIVKSAPFQMRRTPESQTASATVADRRQ